MIATLERITTSIRNVPNAIRRRINPPPLPELFPGQPLRLALHNAGIQILDTDEVHQEMKDFQRRNCEERARQSSCGNQQAFEAEFNRLLCQTKWDTIPFALLKEREKQGGPPVPAEVQETAELAQSVSPKATVQAHVYDKDPYLSITRGEELYYLKRW